MYTYMDEIYDPFYQEMWMQTFHGLNDVSQAGKEACEDLVDSKNLTEEASDSFMNTRYATLNINVSSMPVIIMQGACLPASCN